MEKRRKRKRGGEREGEREGEWEGEWEEHFLCQKSLMQELLALHVCISTECMGSTSSARVRVYLHEEPRHV